MGYGASDRLYGKILFLGPIILFPFALIVFAFSSCNVRHRAEKRACRGGDVKACLYLGTYYEDKAPGILGFLMSYNQDAMTYLDYGCKAKSVEACEQMYQVFAHGADQAKNGSVPLTDTADELIWGCAAGHDTLCDDLFDMSDHYGDWVERRAAMAFDKACNAGNAMACFKLVLMHQQKRAGLQNLVDDVIPLLDKACTANVYDSCKAAQVYRDRKAQLEAEAARGSAAGSGSGAGSASGSAAGSSAP
jgi:hypothetical protein